MPFKLLKRLLKDPNIVGFSLVRKRVYLKAPAAVPREYGEVEAIGEPRLFFLRPQGCSPDFSVSGGEYLTAQHCIGITSGGGRQVMMSDGLPARAVKTNPWRPLTWWRLVLCAIEYFLARRWSCVNADWALVSRGNTYSAAPVGTLSGGTEPPGVTFLAPFTPLVSPREWIGKKVCGVSYDYDRDAHVVNEWEIYDYAVVKYVIEGKVYPVLAWFARGYSKPGFSGTCIYPAGSCPPAGARKTAEIRDAIPVRNAF
jgi:hypothetical protein